MAAFMVRRLLSGVLLVALLTFLTFFVFNEIPTNPACLVVACGPHTTTTDQMIRDADHQLGIDRSVFVQYGHFVWQLVRHGNFGSSWTTQQKVGTMIGDALPVTASLVVGGMVLMMLLALPLGSLAATRARSPLDRSLLGVSVAGIAIHPFVLGIMIQQFAFHHLHISDFTYCPLTGKSSTSTCGGPVDWAGHLAIPWVVFALLFLPVYLRMIRVRVLETLDEPWISTARAKGASEARVIGRHALRNAVGPVLPMLAIDAGTAITAAIYVETVFGLQGLGSLAVRAFSGQAGGFDLPLTAGLVTVVGTFVVLLNVGADVAGAWLDPRIRSKTAAGLIPLPHAIGDRPRARLALNLALGAAVAALLAVAVLHNDGGSGDRVAIGTPVTTVRLGWDDYQRIEGTIPGATAPVFTHGELETRVSRIDFGPHGWRVHATVLNETPFRIGVRGLTPPGTAATYPTQPFSVIVQTDNGGGVRYLKPLPAREFIPALPDSLAPKSSWTGTFAGPDPVPADALYYIGFGQFSYATGYGSPRTFSTSTLKSTHAPAR